MTFTLRHGLAAAVTGLLLAACGTAGGPASGSSSGPAKPAASPVSPGIPAPGTASTAPAPFGYQPLYPFASLTQVRAWQAAFASGGHQPWHLQAGLTALAFTAYLGFPEIDKVAGQASTPSDAHVAVGLKLPNRKVSTAAVIHLVRYGSGKYVPWEVVGTDDTTLTLDVPAYGSTVTSPVTIGGKITGVDENLRAEARTLGATSLVGASSNRPAGGQTAPWSLTVPFRAPPGTVLTIVVHTGGHVAAVERFAVTGIRVR
ncbi:MAG TPA: hypothetical protein VE343_13420 [Streptosporangiaceae bacterium]|jgi:hypothetical protein|nr:hypothetical protein [Streptosporangiaceae bacterium]